MYILLCLYSSEEEIELKISSMETAELYVSLYKKYHMPQSVHKMLLHGADVVDRKEVPVGLPSEAQESRNKDVKNFRENFTRKFSRKQTNQDLLNRLLASSDPYISSLRRSFGSKKVLELPQRAKDLLL